MANAFGKVIVKVAGTTFDNRQGKLWNVFKAEKAGKKVQMYLRREPKNERDEHAIAVIARIEDGAFAKIGYIPADKARWMSTYMDNGLTVRAYAPEKGAKFVHGNKNVNLGVTLKVVYEIPAKAVAVAEATE